MALKSKGNKAKSMALKPKEDSKKIELEDYSEDLDAQEISFISNKTQHMWNNKKQSFPKMDFTRSTHSRESKEKSEKKKNISYECKEEECLKLEKGNS